MEDVYHHIATTGRPGDKKKGGVGGIMSLVLALLMMLTATSCSTKRYVTVPVPEYHYDTLRTITHHRDSIVLRDSVFINRYTRGDTIYSIEQRWHTQYRDCLLRDTAYISSRDTIGVPYPVEKRVPAQLSKFQQMRIWIGNMVIAVLAVCAVWWIISRSNWLRQFLQKHKKQ